MKRSPMARGTSTLKRTKWKPLPKRKLRNVNWSMHRERQDKDQAWSKAVRERDGNRCQWPTCDFCGNVPLPSNDAHHKALRSARPDLRLVLENGVTVCRTRHNWIHGPGRQEAVAAGFLNLETYELAQKGPRA